MNKTSIEWTDFTWNPVTGCHKVSPGCKNCYAETLTNRFAKVWGVESFRDVVMHDDRLDEPVKNKKKWAGKKVFVCSMSDLFQESVSVDFIIKVLKAIIECPDTTFQVLTKRPDRMAQILGSIYLGSGIINLTSDADFEKFSNGNARPVVPIPNLWIGTSCENQETASERIPFLVATMATVRFLSCEPLLGPIDLDNYLPIMEPTEYTGNLHWVIVGGESGHGGRPVHPDWVRSLRDQCASANVPFFFKQWGEWIGNSDFPNEHVAGNYKQYVFNEGTVSAVEVWKLGKSKTGNLLAGEQHLNFPTV